ncbi:protein transport protein sft2 [Mortierella sp. GBA30]|nr:protein transport protein sft2 [Mortierella sp. GBA30]
MSTNTESNFRNAFKNFGARGGVAATDNATTSSGGAFTRASDWFGGVRSQVQGYVPVSLGGTPPQEEDWLGLSWFQRMAGFAICVLGGLACFSIALFIGVPMLALNPSKFATSFTLGSILFMMSFALLKGPMAHFKALISKERLPFTVIYLGSMIFVLWASLGAHSYFLTIIGTIIEILALIYYFTSYSPFSGGSIRLGSRMAGGLLPV